MTHLLKTTTLLGAITTLCFASQTAFAASESIGVNSAVKGDVTIQSGEQAAKQAVVKEPVLLGDVVNSNKVGSLQVLLKDQTTFTVGPDCNLIIDKFVYDPSKNSNSMSATVKKGMFRFMSGNISKSGPDSVSIDTPIASMGVRGTMVEGLIGPEAVAMARNAGIINANTKVDMQNATLFVLRGPGRKSTASNKRGEIAVTSGGGTVTVKKSGMAVFVADQNSTPSQPFMLALSDAGIFHDKLRTKPTNQQSYRPFTVNAGLTPSSGPSLPTNTPFFNPITDMQWPTDVGDLFDEIIFDPDREIQIPGSGSGCSPLNPNFPNC